MKILLITSSFPYFDVQSDSLPTKFLYYYAVEWAKQGHEVLVLHSVRRYPRIFSNAINFLEKWLGFKSLQISRFKQDADIVKEATYEIEGIRVIRTPIRKLIPHRDFFTWDLKKHRKKVLKHYKAAGFKANFIISDFLTPASYIANNIRQIDKAPFFQILHQTDFSYLKKEPNLRNILSHASGVLFRSYSHANQLQQMGFELSYFDFMFTGIPDGIMTGEPRNKVEKLLFVGWLQVTKNIQIILYAMSASKGCNQYELEIIGEGPYEAQLKKLVKKLGLQKQVVFSGRLPRERVFEKMRQVDCLIMVSKETYGMVYIEALSQGCLVIAAKDQGVDGIIVDGENGFIVELDNIQALTKLLDRMMVMDEQDIMRITQNGLQTAKKMTDSQLARDLLRRLTVHLSDS